MVNHTCYCPGLPEFKKHPGLTLPFIIITFGLFKFVINAFLLWLTDKLIEDFEIKGVFTTFIAAFLITIVDSLIKWIL
ncbi:MAG: phage holin family protein [Desulfobacula sp.]|nr:phage holin family protein [Desulfobacula sp.]